MTLEDSYLDDLYDLECPPDDPAVLRAAEKLRTFFAQNPDGVYYENQLCIFNEQEFFHWVTVRALKELRESREIGSELQGNHPDLSLRFYFHRSNRYWRRKAAGIRKLVLKFSAQPFTEALGLHGEGMIDAGFPKAGFMPVRSDVRTWQDKTWTTTGHDLDRVFERDGVFYGTEIKNRLGYIPQQEFRIKLTMCRDLGLIPLFVARFMPKTYIKDVVDAGGFALIMKYQFYPYANREFANIVKKELNLPVDCPARLHESTLDRLLKWHQKNLPRLINKLTP